MSAPPFWKSHPKEHAALRAIAAGCGRAWTDDAIMGDLHWFADQVRMKQVKDIPSRAQLRRDWGVSDWKVRRVLRELWEPMRPKNQPVANRRPTDDQPVANQSARVPDATFNDCQPVANHSPTDDQPVTLHRRVLTEQQSNRATEQQSLVPPAEPEAPTVKPDPPKPTRWEAEGVSLGSGVNAKHITADVFEVWMHWRNLRKSTKRGNPRSLQKADVRAIRSGLRVKAEEVEGLPDGFPVKRIMLGVLDYAFLAPAGSQRVDSWRSGGYLKPQNLLRAEKLVVNAEIVLRSGWRRNGKPTEAVPHHNGKHHNGTAKTDRLWAAWTHPFDAKAMSVQAGVPEDRWLDYVRHLQGVGSAQQISGMHSIDRKAARQQFGERVAAWDNGRQETRP